MFAPLWVQSWSDFGTKSDSVWGPNPNPFWDQIRTHFHYKNNTLKLTLQSLIRQLESLNPLQKLAQGYARIQNAQNKPVRSVQNLQKNEIITITMIDGKCIAEVQDIEKKD